MIEQYFVAGVSWSDRLASVLATAPPFVKANAAMVDRWLVEHGARVVINIGADGLLAVLGGERYKNKYELKTLGGPERKPSPRRVSVDKMLGFMPDGRDWYFGAVALGGAGVRFYGEYCLVLRDSVRGTTLLDRNSYDLTDPPLDQISDVVTALRGTWNDLPSIFKLKILPHLQDIERLVTVGVLSELVLHDEDFIEVHMQRLKTAEGTGAQTPVEGGFDRTAIEEIRQAPEEVAQEEHLIRQFDRTRLPTSSELLWAARRSSVDRQLDTLRIPNRVVTTEGRGVRWR